MSMFRLIGEILKLGQIGYLTVIGNLSIIYEVNIMQIIITSLENVGSSLTFTQTVPAKQFPGITQVGQDHSPVSVEGTVIKTKAGYLVSGTVQLSLTLTCSRCLSPFVYHLKADFSEEYVAAASKAHDPDLAEMLDAAPTYSGDAVDITELVTESILLEIPMRPLCRSDCKGICPECGQLLNNGTCQCDRHQPDPRLAVLADLLKKE